MHLAVKFLVFIFLINCSRAVAPRRRINFMEDIYRTLKNDGNFVFSPYNLQQILSLTLQGSDTTTRKILEKLLPGDSQTSILAKRHRNVTRYLKNIEDISLLEANKFYFPLHHKPNFTFAKIASQNFDTEIETVNFSKSNSTAATINSWISKTTKQKINDLVQTDDLNAFTSLVYSSGIYFKGKWMDDVIKIKGRSIQPFYLNNNEMKQVEMMQFCSNNVHYADVSVLDAKVLDIPYVINGVFLTLILPNKNNGIEDLKNKLFSPDLDFSSIDLDVQEKVDIVIPRIKIETILDFKDVLTEVGFAELFSHHADLSNMLQNKQDVGKLHFSKLIQKTRFELDETGSQTLTTRGSNKMDMSQLIEKPAKFIADHPFLFFISYNQEWTGNIDLFCGQVCDP